MKRSPIRSYALHVLALIVLAAGFSADRALAQENGNTYKKKFNNGLKVAKAGQKAVKSGNVEQGVNKFDEAIATFKEVAQAATEAEDSKLAQKSNYLAAQLAYTSGRAMLNKKNNENALEYFQQGIDVYPKYAKNFRGKGIVLRRMERSDDALNAYCKAIEVGQNNSDYQTVSKAETGIRDQYVYKASQLLSSDSPSTSDANQALKHLGKIEQCVEPNAKAYYYMAVAHNVKGNYSQAVSYADQALAAGGASRSDQARMHFQKGKALMKAGNESAACSSFGNATSGDVKSRAKYNMKQLGCAGASSSE
jgi:tetratricopeptide (TPR) repeat protein